MNLLSPRLRPARVAVATFALALVGFLWLYTRSPVLLDTDSYYHLTIARAQAEEGLHHEFPWVRFGILARGFGDKELLFHSLLVPFVKVAEPQVGGRVALAFLNATLLATVAWIAAHVLGWWAAAVPLWLWLGSSELAWRMVRLRPELLSALLLLAGLWAVARRRYRLLGLVAALYALSYVAIHAFVGLCVLLFLAIWLAERRWDWPLLLYPALGAGVGLLVHPEFPYNLTVVWFHAVEFFRFKGTLDVGTEIRPNFTDVTLMANLGWWLGLLVLWRSSEPAVASPSPEESRRPALCFGVAAVVFGGLYLLMSRFSIYAVLFVSLWLIFEISRRGRQVTGRVRLIGGRHMPLWGAALICFLVALPIAARELNRYRAATDAGPDDAALADWRAWARAVPPGARVAARWGSAAIYMFYAPWGRYLNVLDPGLLAYSDPEIYDVQWRVFEGTEPDVPLHVFSELESEYLSYRLVAEREELTARLENDPRVVPVYRGGHGLFRICGGCNAGFVLDWRAKFGLNEGLNEGLDGEAGWSEYPRRTDASRGVEGFVDASRVVDRMAGRVADGERCTTVSRTETVEQAESRLYELAPYGPASFALDGRRLVETGASLEAVLGRGVVVPVDLEPGERRFTVITCAAHPGAPSGFYLLRRR
jgi:hypothetical protein